MKLRTRSMLWGLVTGAVLFGGYSLIARYTQKSRKPRFTATFTVTLNDPDNPKPDATLLARTEKVLRSRASFLSEDYTVTAVPGKGFELVLRNINDTAALRKTFTVNGELAIWEMYTLADAALLSIMQRAVAVAPGYLRPAENPVQDSNRDTSLQSILVFNQPTSGYPQLPAIGTFIPDDEAQLMQILQDSELKKITPSDLVFLSGPDFMSKGPEGKKRLALYAIRTFNQPRATINNDDIADASLMYDHRGELQVDVKMTPAGKRRWADMTTRNINKPLAMVFDNVVLTAPTVNEPITDGNTRIMGAHTEAEARYMAAAFRSGNLPLRTGISALSITKQGLLAGRFWTSLGLFLLFFATGTGISWFVLKNIG